jgi:hypothetical protein
VHISHHTTDVTGLVWGTLFGMLERMNVSDVEKKQMRRRSTHHTHNYTWASVHPKTWCCLHW